MPVLNTWEHPGYSHRPTIFTGGPIHTMAAGAEASPEAMLNVGPYIVAVGSLADCRRAAAAVSPEDVVVRDLAGASLLPGFIDAHAHPLMLGQLMTWVDCGPEKAGSIPEIIALLKAAAREQPRGKPVRGFGYEQQNLQEKRHPTRFELDQVSTEREVYLMNASGHGGVVNSFALDLHGVDRHTPNPPGGEFFRTADGELTGELSDAACNVLTGVDGVKTGSHGPNFHLADAPEQHLEQLRVAQETFLSGGVSTIGDAQVSRREFDTYLRLAQTGELKTRVSMYLLSHLLDAVLEIGLRGKFGNSRLSFAGIKLYADGTLGGWTAYFPEGYLGDPCRTGQLYHEPAEYRELLRKAHAAGLQTATHAQSPTAIGLVIEAIEAAQAEHPDADARHRVEHCGLPTTEQINRMVTAGIRPVNQPQHYYNWGEGVTDAIGTPGERFNPLGEFHAAGLPITISSDAPVATPRPLEAVQAAVTRVTRNGHQLGSDSLRITVDAALRAHTINAATTLGRETEIGSIEVGKRADFVILSADPLNWPEADISTIEVMETWVDGRRQFSASTPDDESELA